MTFEKYIVSGSTSGGKFWEVEVADSDMRIRYGKLGADPKWSTKSFDSAEKALKEAEKKYNSKIRKGYADAPRPGQVDADGVNLTESPVNGVFYFRAFDRCPGGNNDIFTVKVTLEKPAGGSATIKAQTYHDWDGEHWTYPEATVEFPNQEASVNALLLAAQALIDNDAAQSEFSIIDNRSDREEYDTEWSSLEFSLHVPDGEAEAPGKLVSHVVQKALSFTKSKGKPADEASQAFIDAVMNLVGLDRVQHYSDNEDVFSKTYNPLVKGESHGYKSAEVPLYL